MDRTRRIPLTRHPLIGAALLAATLPALAVGTSTVTFANGTEGFAGPQGAGGRSFITLIQGHERPAYRTRFSDFGITFATSTNSNFVGDYTAVPAVEIGLDVKTLSIDFFGQAVTRDLVVELRDHDGAPDGMPYVSVWYKLGTLDASKIGWETLSVTIANTGAAALPAGWGGYGAEDPVTYEPMLPADRTFASVLAGVDEIAFTTYVPGWFYGETAFDVIVDNVFIRTLSAVPEAPGGLLFGAGLLALGAWRQRASIGFRKRPV